MYIPLMAFITYVLLVGLCLGAQYKFTPDVLGLTSSTASVTVLLEVLLIKLSLVVLNFPPVSFLDLIAYSGYKFVPTTVSILLGLALGTYGFYAAFVYTSLMMSIFLVRTYKTLIPKSSVSNSNALRNYFLLVIGAIQFLLIYFLCYIDFNGFGFLGGDSILSGGNSGDNSGAESVSGGISQ
eukprot:TRINITY_DN2247_c0_g1_i1.p1 TRINITY_DN2247_c0_g1~~TRINITY_DN2247_c0_g1_i1.p1  ORF type:complete len:182 (+),score=28.70 TRINITY_DN2247_c0_g1_i1:560-1105(+)